MAVQKANKPKKRTKPKQPKTTQTPKKAVKQPKNNFTLDRKTGRWRNNGKYSKPPKKSQLRKDSKGRPLDALGKRIPSAALTLPKRAAKPTPKATPTRKKPPTAPKGRPKGKAGGKPTSVPRKRPVQAPSRPPERPRPPKVRPRRVRRGRVELVPDGQPVTERQILSSSFENMASPANIGEVLYNVIGSKARKAGKSPNDLVLYRYGISFTNTADSGSEHRTGLLVEKLATEYPDFSFQYNANIVNVTLGKADDPTGRNTAQSELIHHADALEDMHAYLYDLWEGDLGWFAIAENDEHAGGS